MSSTIRTHIACPDQIECRSSDAATEYDWGIKCFSCNKNFGKKSLSLVYNKEYPSTSTAPAEATTKTYTKEYLAWRGISAETFRAYDVPTYIAEDGKPHHVAFTYPGGGVKNRLIDNKEFWSQGAMSAPGLFGQGKFPPGSARAITITEGELDALSVYQMLGSQYPSVSIRSSGSAGKDCGKVFDYLNSFEKIYLCLDTDEVGKKAAREIASLFDFNKVFEVRLGDLKDANEYLKAGKEKEFRNVWFNSRRYLPEGIVSSLSEFRGILDEDRDKPSIPGPFASLDLLTMGIRTGEFILVTAPEGIGKTEFIRRFEHHLLKTTTVPIGCIHLEETKSRQLKGIAGLELGVPAHLPTSSVSIDEVEGALRKLTDNRDDRLHIYSHFGSDDPDVLLEAIRFLVAVCGCKYVFLDHITMVVTGLENDDERKTLDYLSTKLATMVHDMDFTLFCISHVNDDGKTRGSRNISKVANLRIDLSRNLVAELEEERNKTFVTVSKNRFAGKTGPAGVLAFDVDEFMLKEAHEVIHLPPVD